MVVVELIKRIIILTKSKNIKNLSKIKILQKPNSQNNLSSQFLKLIVYFL